MLRFAALLRMALGLNSRRLTSRAPAGYPWPIAWLVRSSAEPGTRAPLARNEKASLPRLSGAFFVRRNLIVERIALLNRGASFTPVSACFRP